MQKQFNLNPRTRSNEVYNIRCHSALSYGKGRNKFQSTSFLNDEALSFSKEFARIVHKFCPNVQINFLADSWEEILQTIDATFQRILENMKEQLNIEFIKKEEQLKKTTAKLN